MSVPINPAALNESAIAPARSPTKRRCGRESSVSASIEHAPGVIKSVEDIERLLASRTFAKRLPRSGLPIDLPGITDETRRLLAIEVKRFARACGCASGAAGFLVTSAASIVTAYRLVLIQHWLALFYLVLGALIVVPATTAAAKMLGHEAARRRFRRSCNRLIRQVDIHGSGSIRREET